MFNIPHHHSYRQEYNKSLKMLDKLPAYKGWINTHNSPPVICWFHAYYTESRYAYFTSTYHPNKYYFQILKNTLSIYAKSKVNYNMVILEIKKMQEFLSHFKPLKI